MTVGQWLGNWVGSWFGSGEPAPEGSLRGTATISLAASGSTGAVVTLQGTADISVSASAYATAVGCIDGAANLAVGGTATGTAVLVSDGAISGSAIISLVASGTVIQPEVVTVAEPLQQSTPAGTSGDAGTGYRYIDRAWVKGLKVVKIGTTWQSTGSVKNSGFATPRVRAYRTKTFGGTVRSTSHCVPKARAVASGCPHQTLKADSACQSKTAKSIVSMYNGSSTSLGADELLAILNWM